MEIKNERDGKKGAFYIEENGVRVGTMSYVFMADNAFIIDHTEVDASQEGKGLGRKLVQAGVDYARENDLKILPLCPYAKKIFEKTPEYEDVLFKMEAK